MANLRVRSTTPDDNGCVLSITPESAGWEFVGFAVHRLADGQLFKHIDEDRETCVVILSGRATIRAGGEEFVNIGSRNSVFDRQPPHAVYIPNDVPYEIQGVSNAEVALCSAPGTGTQSLRLIEPGSLPPEDRGEGTNRRYVQNILPETELADSLLVVEVITPPGNWSSYPPHKHDSDELPNESKLEETYYHRLNPQQGFAFQRVYTDDRSLDETISVEDGDCVMVPEGYHPVGAPHGYELYYLNVMAGPRRQWVFKNDPMHEWMLEA